MSEVCVFGCRAHIQICEIIFDEISSAQISVSRIRFSWTSALKSFSWMHVAQFVLQLLLGMKQSPHRHPHHHRHRNFLSNRLTSSFNKCIMSRSSGKAQKKKREERKRLYVWIWQKLCAEKVSTIYLKLHSKKKRTSNCGRFDEKGEIISRSRWETVQRKTCSSPLKSKRNYFHT